MATSREIWVAAGAKHGVKRDMHSLMMRARSRIIQQSKDRLWRLSIFLTRLRAFLFNRIVVALTADAQVQLYHERRYADGVRHFELGNLNEALRAFSVFLKLTRQSAIIAPNALPYGLSNIHNYDDFEKAFQDLLDERARDWEANQRPFPRFLHSRDDEELPDDQIPGKKILFFTLVQNRL